jgi:hypothetical protein
LQPSSRMSKKLSSRARQQKLKSKQGVTSPSVLAQIQHPVFCLHYLDSQYCLTKCNQEERASFANTIRMLSQIPWNEIIAKGVHGYEKIINKKSVNRGNLPSCITEDTPIIGFHFHKKKPMVGFRRECIFHIVWFDPKFTLYKH